MFINENKSFKIYPFGLQTWRSDGISPAENGISKKSRHTSLTCTEAVLDIRHCFFNLRQWHISSFI